MVKRDGQLPNFGKAQSEYEDRLVCRFCRLLVLYTKMVFLRRRSVAQAMLYGKMSCHYSFFCYIRLTISLFNHFVLFYLFFTITKSKYLHLSKPVIVRNLINANTEINWLQLDTITLHF
jgi:hypothetical protein